MELKHVTHTQTQTQTRNFLHGDCAGMVAIMKLNFILDEEQAIPPGFHNTHITLEHTVGYRWLGVVMPAIVIGG